MSRFGPALATAATLTVAIALGGCAAVEPVVATPSPSPTYAPTGDGVLRIGTLLPTGSTALVAGVEVAVREINEQGGINGVPVEVFHRSSGDPATETAELAFDALVALGVDVVIGPDSADLAERLAGPAATANVAIVSPTARGLDSIEDSDLVFGTAAPAAAKGAAIADALREAGAASVAYLASDDEVGAQGLTQLAGELGDDIPVAFDADFPAATTNFTSIASKAAKAKPDAVVVSTATAEQAVALLSALAGAGLDGSSIWLDARSTLDYAATLPAGLLDGATGIVVGAAPDEAFALRLRQADPAVSSYGYAAEAYDATIMAALAVAISGDDGGPAISRHLRSISTGGIACSSFGECLSVLATEPDIDYTGRSGPVDLAESGDAATGTVTIVTYAESNSFTADRTVTAG